MSVKIWASTPVKGSSCDSVLSSDACNCNRLLAGVPHAVYAEAVFNTSESRQSWYDRLASDTKARRCDRLEMKLRSRGSPVAAAARLPLHHEAHLGSYHFASGGAEEQCSVMSAASNRLHGDSQHMAAGQRNCS